MTFLEFVAIKLPETPERSIARKAMTSYLNFAAGCEDSPVEDTLRVWITNMIDKGLASSSRRRYVEKLSTIYKAYASEHSATGDPFEAIRELRDYEAGESAAVLQANTARLSEIFDMLMSEARTDPALALFVYLLFHASADIEGAIGLTVDDYTPVFTQLEAVIDPTGFHHLRRYVFPLGQSRKRMPRLKAEVMGGISSYLHSRGLVFPEGFSSRTIVALWASKARSIGVALSDLRHIVGEIPAEMGYLRYVDGPAPSAARVLDIKRNVAEAFAPTSRRWYALKLRRGAKFDALRAYLAENLGGEFDDRTLFYPRKELSRRVDHKIITEHVPVIPDVVFMHILPGHIRRIDMLTRMEGYGWVFRVSRRAESDYSVIPPGSMLAFQHVIGTFTPDIKVTLTRENPIGIGRRVRITGGIMEGYTGTIYDIRPGADTRHIFIRLSPDYAIKAEVAVEEIYVEALNGQ